MDVQTIRNPVECVIDELREVATGVAGAGRSIGHTSTHLFSRPLAVSKIELSDLKEVLASGFDDFMAYRTDIVFLLLIYPLASLAIGAAALHHEFIPMLFPIVSGSVIMGPFVGVVLYELSRRREINLTRHHVDSHSWANALSVTRRRNFGAIMLLGLMLVAMYLVWLGTAFWIYRVTHGPQAIESVGRFVADLFLTQAGWWLIGIGLAVGFLFAVLALMMTVVSFPLLIDRDVGLGTAVQTSFRAVRANPLPIAAWGLVVAGGLVVAAIPLLIGLAIAMPVLCHASWHLYRKLVPRLPAAH
ncbi:DUF2189 domain-containing protein [Dongia sp.]|uniref:DUF2189 domain-containing protein n=1 Tax=Dongia sp. TaxID=1977262 RepID=UPI0037515C87